MRAFAPKISPRFWNGVAKRVITVGGIALVLAVIAILVFIAREALPLAGKPSARELVRRAPSPGAATAEGDSDAILAGVDEQRQILFLVRPHDIHFVRADNGATVLQLPHAFGDSARATCAAFDPHRGLLAIGSSDGRGALGALEFEESWESGQRRATPKLRWLGTAQVDSAGRALERIAGDRNDDGEIALVALTQGGAADYVLLDASGSPAARAELGSALGSQSPSSVLLSLRAPLLAVGAHDGTLYLWKLDDARSPQLEDHVRASTAEIGALALLLGDQSLAVGTADGEVAVWFRSRYVRATNEGSETIDLAGEKLAPGEERVVLDRAYGRQFAHVPGLRFTTAGQPWTRVHGFPLRPGAVTSIAPSPRTRGFAVADTKGVLRLYQATSERVLLEMAAGTSAQPRSVQFAPKGDGLVALAADGRVHAWELHNPHPEVSLQALFGRVWYEGYVEPQYVWQSTGGSDDFEPKLGLVPLLVGTLKGTLYALLFSVPISVLAALYLSQLASPGVRNVVKPCIELMAAMPSVVVGFLAALWLAPILEDHLVSIAGALLVVPLSVAAAIAVWYTVPERLRRRAKPGFELGFLVPFVLLAAWAGAALGHPLETHLFGGDLKQWLYDHQGIRYDQRNCIVVGIALGFAVIPIIFTICEDAMSAVPRSLTSAALALGASRWQSALHVILPAASPGVFAAIMLGLGRAIGETMIVLMATGNTPILDLSPFNGMRTMSAGIAVEISEAPHGGTLYRVLFLTGVLLFMFTFVLNTAADLVSRSLRKRYGQF